MVFWLRKNKEAAPGMTPESGHPAPASLSRRLGRAAIFLLKMMFQRKDLARLALLSLLALAAVSGYGFAEWWDQTYPKPPRRIITGELLKGFERYSRDERHVEKVLGE
ncbi:hypothetical protein MTO96_007688 [Rhipicephalus appendiculatus]